MSISVVKDLEADDAYSDGINGPEAARGFKVSGVTGPVSSRAKSAALAAGIPRRGDRHPSDPTLVAINVEARPDGGGTQYRVMVTYGRPTVENQEPSTSPTEQGVITIGSLQSTVQTNKDKDGNLLSIKLRRRDDPNTEVTQTGTVEIQSSIPVIQIVRREPFPPLWKSIEYGFTVNASAIGSFAKRTLLCLPIEGESDDGGVTYSNTYQFAYNRRTWDSEATFIDETTNKPHVDVDVRTGNGILVARVITEKDFGPLGINLFFPGIPK